MDGHDIVVVGGGIAGLTAAAYASRDGYRVLLCEKQERVGGLANSFVRNGFTFDQGIRSIENSGIVFPMLRQLGIDLRFVHSPVSLGIDNRMIKIDSPASIEQYRELLQELFPAERADVTAIIGEIKTIMGYMDTLYGIDNPLFLDSYKDIRYVMGVLLPWMFRYRRAMPKIARLDEPVEEFLHRFTGNQALIDLIAQHFFAKTPTFFALSYFSLYLDYQYPVGGTGALAGALEAFIRSRGGEIRTGIPIETVDPDSRTVYDRNGRAYPYRQLVWAADMKTLYRQVATNPSGSTSTKAIAAAEHSRLQDLRGGDSILSVFICTDLPPSYFAARSSAHVFHTPSANGLSQVPKAPRIEPSEQAKQSLWSWLAQYFAYNTFEISLPVLRDPSLAPEGKTGLIASTLFDFRLAESIREAGWYEEFKRISAENMIRQLSTTLYPDLAQHVTESFCATPLTIAETTGNWEGAITGWAFTNDCMPAVHEMKRMMQAVDTPFKNVWQAGQWTFSPSGLPISVLTGRLASQQAAKRLRR